MLKWEQRLTLAVNIIVHDMIAHVREHVLSSVVALRVRGPHICWEKAQNISKSHFIVVHLIFLLLNCQGSQVLVRPCVAGDLVTGFMHALEELGIAGRNVVYLAFAHVVSSNEERCLGIILVQNIENVLCIDIRPVVKRQSNMALVCAEINTGSSVADIAEVRPGNI